MKLPVKIPLAGIVLLGLLGCVRVPASVSAASTPLEGRPYQVLGPVTATTRQSFILGLIPVQSEPERLAETIAAATRKANADALIDLTVETMTRNYVLWATYTTEVRGTAIRFTGAKT
jgi:hypothetical protein